MRVNGWPVRACGSVCVSLRPWCGLYVAFYLPHINYDYVWRSDDTWATEINKMKILWAINDGEQILRDEARRENGVPAENTETETCVKQENVNLWLLFF